MDQDERDKSLNVGFGHCFARSNFLKRRVSVEVPLELRLDDLLIGLHVDGLEACRAAIGLNAGGVLRDIDYLRRKRHGTLPLMMMHDFPQGPTNSL